MQIWIHDSNMKKIVALNNDIPDMLSYSNSTWHTYLDQATSTFDFTIPKFVNGELHEDIKLINDECFVSFYVNGSYQVFYIATLQEDDFNIQLTCNNTNLEYALEYANPFSTDGAQTIEWYLNHMDLLSFAAVEIGINEISDRKRTLTFDSQETKMSRLQSLMSNFDAEFEFKVELNRDGTYKRIVINIYQKADETHHGIGSDRKDVVLYYSNGLKGVQVSSDKTQMFNAGVFTGKDGLSLNDVEISEKNADGIEEFYSRKGNPYLYAPLAMNRYRATMRAEGQDNWIRKDFTTEYENINDLKAYALRTLKQYAYPLMTYTASVQSNFIGQYTYLKLGDTVRIVDKNFVGGLALEARVSEMIISFDMPLNNSVVFTNFRKLENKPSDALQQRIDEIVSKSLPYHVEIRTTNGTVFKNGVGQSTVKPVLKQGDKIVNATYRFVIDGTIKYSGMTYDMVASEITQPTTLTIAAWVDNKEVASEEVTFLNVSDGVGIRNTTITYAIGTSGTVAPTNGWSSQVPNVPEGNYLWTKTVWDYTDNTSETGYSVAKMGEAGPKGDRGEQGPKGDQGIPGPKGADGKTQYIHIAYADTVSGSGFSQTDSNKAYIGIYQDFNAYDSQNPQDYRWSKWKGSDGRDGIPGKAGADGRTPYVHFAYADSADGKTGFSLTQTGRKRYLGVLTNFVKEDSTNPSDYTWNDTAGSISIGGDNLIINSAFPKNLNNWGFWETGLPNKNLNIATHGFYYNGTKPLFRLDANTNIGVSAATKRFPVKQNTDYSFNIQTFATGNINGLTIYFLGRKANETDKTFTKVVAVKTYSGSPSVTQTVKWHLTFNSGDCDEGFIRIDNNGSADGKTSMLFFAELDCYEGTTDRSWQASPNDLRDEIDTKADDVLTQAQLNRLNEMNSIVKAELAAKASLDTLDQWKQAYQDFVNANNANRAQAEKDLADASARVTKLENNLNDMSERWNFIDSYMSASENGLVIGRKDNSSSIMFNPNGRISMISAGNEVMYISKGVIHIENGIFSKTVQIGRFREEQDLLNPDRNVIRYVGGA